MFLRSRSKKGQNTAEYAILIGVIVAAAIAMQVYIRRGVQARIKDAVDFTMTADDDMGGNIFSANLQYEPYYDQGSTYTTQSSAQTTEELQLGGGVVRDSISQYTDRTGNQVIANYEGGN
jgi:gas vesicle protein